MNTSRQATVIWAAVAVMLGLALGIVLVATRGVQGTSGGAGAPDAEGAGVGVELAEFSITPDPLEIGTADAVLEVTNVGAAPHDLTVDGGPATPVLDPGGTARLDLTALAPGTYRMFCSVPGHAGAGMEATLVIAADAAATGDPAPGATASEASPETMAARHEQNVRDFPAATDRIGGQPLAPEVLADGTKRFVLTAAETTWEVTPGETVQALAYNGQVPGPELRVQLGDRVRIELVNRLDEPTTLHGHGLTVPNDMDGVPGLTQASVLPGESFTYEYVVRNAGTHMYHSHFNSTEQVTRGLLGAFIVEDPATDPAVDLDHTVVLGDGALGYTLNGKGFPATQPLVVARGDQVRIRYLNEGLAIHPMHLHGMAQRVIALDGYPLAQPYTADTVLVAPGQRVDVLVEATEPGSWALHCHVLSHAEGPDGLFGMVTALVVEEPDPA